MTADPPEAFADPPEAIPAAAVIPLRQNAQAMEVLLLQRHRRLSFFSGAWAFPGGKIEALDFADLKRQDWLAAAARAAVRELAEEAGLIVAQDQLLPYCRWTTPDTLPLRYTTWFFAAAVGSGSVTIDGRESVDHRWLQLDHALTEHRISAIRLPPPTFVILQQLLRYHCLSAALADLSGKSPVVYRPRMVATPDGPCYLYPGDSGHDDGILERPGRRHRLCSYHSQWLYEDTPGH